MDRIDFNSCKGTETIFREYKEFRMFSKHFDIKSCREYCETNKYNFNDVVYDDIVEYIEYYIPKYYTAFMNSHIKGSLFLGVNDYGFVRGIPFQGDLPTTQLNEIIYKYLNNNVNHFQDTIEIKWIKVENIPEPIVPIIPEYTKYIEEKQKYDDAYNTWYELMTDYEIKFAFYSRKLVKMGNEIECRKLIVDYIKSIDPNSESIAFFESTTEIKSKESEELLRVRDDPNEPIYWIMRWKDYIIDKIRNEKPQFNVDFPQYNVPLNLITNVGRMISYWKQNNGDMNSYVLQIKFNPEEDTQYDFSYLDSKTRNIWMKSYRILREEDNSPSTRTYKVEK